MKENRNPQLDVIETLNCPVIVQAGAGSGKTHTLTERIIYALKPNGENPSFASSVENIVAITFTRKAAEELKSRLRTKLEKSGLHEQSLLVDDAFITTIHGFAARILRENALNFDLDVNFTVIDEARDTEIFNQALENSMSKMFYGQDVVDDIMKSSQFDLNGTQDISADEQDSEYEEITYKSEYSTLPAELDKKIQDFVVNMVTSEVQNQSIAMFSEYLNNNLLFDETFSIKNYYDVVLLFVKAFSTLPVLVDSNVFIGTFLTPNEIMGKVSRAAADALSNINLDEKIEKEGDIISALESTIKKIEYFLEDDINLSDTEIFEDACLILDDIPTFSPKFHHKEPDFDAVVAYRETIAHAMIELLATANRQTVQILYHLASLTFSEMNNIKGGGELSNDDLLRVCYQKLNANKKIANAYKNRFDLIMIDEFQDTDVLQLELIKLISKNKFKNVCTVGDVQQSIYRFRGADVNVFKNYKRALLSNSSGVRVFNLPNNYRSHADILSLTDKIFASEEMFGEDFLHLNPKGKINEEDDSVFENIPRVEIQVINHSTSGRNKFLTKDAVEREAMRAAIHFKKLKDRGANNCSMAILLSKLTSGATTSNPCEYGKIYQTALQNVGIESVISGGTTFSMSVQAQIVLTLLALARNPLESDSLIFLLKQDFFDISDDALLMLSSNFDSENERNGFLCKQDISFGFLSLSEAQQKNLSEVDAKLLDFARTQITTYIDEVQKYGPIFAIRNFLSNCGVFDKLQTLGSEGLVCAGNYEKALEIIREIQKDCFTINQIHESFSSFLENSKESPGILSTIKSNYVEIMTVHASKGLEFDHVIVSELRDGRYTRQNNIIKNSSLASLGQNTYVSLIKKTNRDTLQKIAFDKNLSFEKEVIDHRAMTAGELYRKLVMNEQKEELDEAKRLLYVALTRAVKSVLLQVRIAKAPKDDYANTGIWEFLYSNLKWDYNCDRSVQFVELSNGSKAKLSFEFLPSALEFSDDELDTFIKDDSMKSKSCSSNKLVERSPRKHHVYSFDVEQMSDFISYSQLEKLNSNNVKIQTLPNNIKISSIEDDEEHYFDKTFDEDRATDFGNLLHSFFERGTLLEKFDLSFVNSKRFRDALNRVLATPQFTLAMSCARITPEMDFCVPIKIDNKLKFIRGQIDLFASNGNDAYVIDYKTGKTPLDHTLQAQVYAYALIKSGICKVDLSFIHAEIPSESGSGAFVQEFSYSSEDINLLVDSIAQLAKKL